MRVQIIDTRNNKVLDTRELQAELYTPAMYEELNKISQEFKQIPSRCLQVKPIEVSK